MCIKEWFKQRYENIRHFRYGYNSIVLVSVTVTDFKLFGIKHDIIIWNYLKFVVTDIFIFFYINFSYNYGTPITSLIQVSKKFGDNHF